MIENLKPFYSAILKPALKVFVALRIKPNHITVMGLLLFVVSGGYCAAGRWRTALVFVILGAFADGWDGLLAREYNLKSVFGGIFDSCVDRLTEIALLGGLFLFWLRPSQVNRWGCLGVLAATTGSLMVSYVKARSEAEGIACTKGILQRPERIILLCIGLLFGAGFTIATVELMQAIVWTMAVLAFLTTTQRLWAAFRNAPINHF